MNEQKVQRRPIYTWIASSSFFRPLVKPATSMRNRFHINLMNKDEPLGSHQATELVISLTLKQLRELHEEIGKQLEKGW